MKYIIKLKGAEMCVSLNPCSLQVSAISDQKTLETPSQDKKIRSYNLDDLELEGFVSDHSEVPSPNEKIPLIETSNNVEAYYWIQSKDAAFRGEKRDKERQWYLKNRFGEKHSHIFYQANHFFSQMYHLKKKKEKIGLLVISGHGTANTLGHLKLLDDGRIQLIHGQLNENIQKTIFSHYLKHVLADKSVVVLDACLTASSNKGGLNIAQAISNILPQSYIFASQYETIYEPDISFGFFNKKRYVSVSFGIQTEQKNLLELSNTNEAKAISQVPAIVYHRGAQIKDEYFDDQISPVSPNLMPIVIGK